MGRMISRALFALAALALALPAVAQDLVTVTIKVTHDGKPVAGAEVIVSAQTLTTDKDGVATVRLPMGAAKITVTKPGFLPAVADVVVATVSQTHTISLERAPEVEESVTVAATRTGGRLDDSPTRVEVLNREEIEEKMLMTPGDIVMMLNEMGGMRVQATSPGLGAATVRVQGTRGRYTRFFSDGLPLFGEVGGLGLLQIPPMDLGQVEVIKGIASSLYGAGAMGGVVNLVSRQPGEEREREIMFNQSTRGATDVVGWYATAARTGWAMTLLGGGHFQLANDVNDDTWADLAGYTRGVVRPRLFWNNGKGSSFFATVGYTAESRNGGTGPDTVLPQAGVPYVESLETHRVDGGFVAQTLLGGKYLWAARAALSNSQHRHEFGEIIERDRHRTTFIESTVRVSSGAHVFVAGAAIEGENYRGTDVTQWNFDYWTPGVFGQADIRLAQSFLVSLSGRLDHHNVYGTFFSPRISALLRRGAWTSRLSVGGGFFGPSALTEETEAAGLTRVTVPEPFQAERGRNASIDLTRQSGPLSVTVTLFGSRVKDPLNVDRSAGLVMTNLTEPSTTAGVEVLGTYRRGPIAVTGSYTFVEALETTNAGGQDVALTPRHSAGVVGMWEKEDVGRVGIECYFTGTQRLDENPYATRSESYVILGVLAERRFGRFRLFVNGENLTGVRQTKWDPLIRPSRAADGRWTVDAWAPLEGRNINGGIRIAF